MAVRLPTSAHLAEGGHDAGRALHQVDGEQGDPEDGEPGVGGGDEFPAHGRLGLGFPGRQEPGEDGRGRQNGPDDQDRPPVAVQGLRGHG